VVSSRDQSVRAWGSCDCMESAPTAQRRPVPQGNLCAHTEGLSHRWKTHVHRLQIVHQLVHRSGSTAIRSTRHQATKHLQLVTQHLQNDTFSLYLQDHARDARTFVNIYWNLIQKTPKLRELVCEQDMTLLSPSAEPQAQPPSAPEVPCVCFCL
jgi:hypothetical protein